MFILAADHDWGCGTFVTSVIHTMNITEHSGDLLYNSGDDGHGWTFVSVHDTILDLSPWIKHVAHLYKFVKLYQHFMYLIKVECDGGPDHNLNFLSN